MNRRQNKTCNSMLGHIFSGPVHLNKCCDLTPVGKDIPCSHLLIHPTPFPSGMERRNIKKVKFMHWHKNSLITEIKYNNYINSINDNDNVAEKGGNNKTTIKPKNDKWCTTQLLHWLMSSPFLSSNQPLTGNSTSLYTEHDVLCNGI